MIRGVPEIVDCAAAHKLGNWFIGMWFKLIGRWLTWWVMSDGSDSAPWAPCVGSMWSERAVDDRSPRSARPWTPLSSAPTPMTSFPSETSWSDSTARRTSTDMRARLCRVPAVDLQWQYIWERRYSNASYSAWTDANYRPAVRRVSAEIIRCSAKISREHAHSY